MAHALSGINEIETVLGLSAAHVRSPKKMASRQAALSGNASLIATFSSSNINRFEHTNVLREMVN